MDISTNNENISSVSFSLYRDEDYDGFFACINDFYKGGYPYKEYLDRENLKSLSDRGDIIITLAKDSCGRIVGTSSALRLRGRFSGSVLLLLRCVLHKMRGLGIGKMQEMFLLGEVERRFGTARSFYADVMTHDARSQTTMIKQGFVFCGLRMALYKNEIIVPYIKYGEGTKMSQAIYCKSRKNIKKPTLYAPAELRDVLKEIYSSLGTEPNFSEDSSAALSDAEYEINENSLHESAEIFVDICGVCRSLEEEIKAIISKGFTAAAYVNMSTEGAALVYTALTRLGFYFSGVKPLSDGGEYLVLSNSENCNFISDNIKLPEMALPLYQRILKEINK